MAQPHAERSLVSGASKNIQPPANPREEAFLRYESQVKRLMDSTQTILIVEDENVVRRMVVHVLTSKGYKVLAACDGHEALRISEEQTEPIDLMITDMFMPKMGGRELAKRLGKARPTMRILFVSGYGEDIVGDDNRIDGACGFLQKPFNIQALTQAVRATLDASPH